jgi:hypothetical protein
VLADLDPDLPVDPAVGTYLERRLDEQALALVFGLGGHAGQPRSRVDEERRSTSSNGSCNSR